MALRQKECIDTCRSVSLCVAHISSLLDILARFFPQFQDTQFRKGEIFDLFLIIFMFPLFNNIMKFKFLLNRFKKIKFYLKIN